MADTEIRVIASPLTSPGLFKYSSWSYQWCDMDSLNSSSGFHPVSFLGSSRLFQELHLLLVWLSHNFSISLAKFWYLSSFLLSFNFTWWSAETSKSTCKWLLFFLQTKIRSGLLAEVEGSLFIWKSQRILWFFIFWSKFWSVYIPFVCMGKV